MIKKAMMIQKSLKNKGQSMIEKAMETTFQVVKKILLNKKVVNRERNLNKKMEKRAIDTTRNLKKKSDLPLFQKFE